MWLHIISDEGINAGLFHALRYPIPLLFTTAAVDRGENLGMAEKLLRFSSRL